MVGAQPGGLGLPAGAALGWPVVAAFAIAVSARSGWAAGGTSVTDAATGTFILRLSGGRWLHVRSPGGRTCSASPRPPRSRACKQRQVQAPPRYQRRWLPSRTAATGSPYRASGSLDPSHFTRTPMPCAQNVRLRDYFCAPDLGLRLEHWADLSRPIPAPLSPSVTCQGTAMRRPERPR